MLLIDIGNSRIKWAYADSGRFVGCGAAVLNEELPASALAAWGRRPPVRVAVADVRGGDVGQRISDWMRAQWGIVPEVAHVSRQALGVRTTYREPANLGVDRWLSLLAVRDRAPVGVIGCGTAITIDVLDSHRIHQGGLIMPGVALQRASLLERSSGIRRGYQDTAVTEWSGVLGRDTADCVMAGTLQAAAGGIVRSVTRIGAQFDAMAWIITGGDGPLINEMLANQFEYAPDLVLRGLFDVMGDQ